MTKNKRVYCLYRVSTLGQVDKDDIPMQKQCCREFAEKQGWTIVKEFSEKGVSGFKTAAKDRDAIQEIQRDAAEGKFDILLGAGSNALDKGVEGVSIEQMDSKICAVGRRVVLLNDKNAVAAVLYEYVTTGKTTGYPAPETGDASTAVFFAIIAVVALGGTVIASKKKFN